MIVNTSHPEMTLDCAVILRLIDTYQSGNYGLSQIEVQKLAYFLQEAGEDLQLRFVKHVYGPYADALRHALDRMDGHFIHGVGDGVVEAEIAPDQDALAEADAFIQNSQRQSLHQHISRVAALIERFQSPYGMELLSSVHWVVRYEQAESAAEAVTKVHAWNERKRHLMQPAHISVAWQQLCELGWITAETGKRDNLSKTL
jgi:uncharacterized protein YwgA